MGETRMNETPVEYKVCVLPDEVEGSTGLIHKPETVIWEETRAQVLGTVVAVSDMAFTLEDGSKWKCRVPKVGDRVRFAKYAGLMTDKIEGKFYRYMNDKDIVAIIGDSNE